MALHQLASMDAPLSVFKKIESILNKFPWSGVQGQQRHWRSWKSLASPIEENGLGVRSMKTISDALSCKLWWKLATSQGCEQNSCVKNLPISGHHLRNDGSGL